MLEIVQAFFYGGNAVELEVGKYYKTRDGRKVGPMRIGQDGYTGHFYWDTDDWGPVSFNPDGVRTYAGYCESIISEWTDSPVSTVTRKEIVPGAYENVIVQHEQNGKLAVWVVRCYDAASIRAAAATLIEIADALEENQ